MLYQSDIRGEACGREALPEPAKPVAQGGDAACELIRGVSVPPQIPSVSWLGIHCEGEAARAASCLSLTFSSLKTLQFPVLPSLLLPLQTQPSAKGALPSFNQFRTELQPSKPTGTHSARICKYNSAQKPF